MVEFIFIDDIIDIVYDIFLEMVLDNFEFVDVILFMV